MSTAASLLEGWVRKDKYHLEHAGGALICKCFVRGVPVYQLSVGKLRLHRPNLREAMEDWQQLTDDERSGT